MKRRDFITLLGSAAATWPMAARAQLERMRRIGVLMSLAQGDPEGRNRLAAFVEALRDLGWSEGGNLKIDVCWGGADSDRYRAYAEELVALAPDILLGGGPTVRPLYLATRTIPIVFAALNDPVGGGYVASLARPGGNITGFSSPEYGVSAKLLELLKQIAPNITRAMVIRNANVPGGFGLFGALQGAAATFGVELSPLDIRDATEIERAITAFAGGSNGGLVVTSGGLALNYRQLIISLAAQHRLPAIYSNRLFVVDGGLICYARAPWKGGVFQWV